MTHGEHRFQRRCSRGSGKDNARMQGLHLRWESGQARSAGVEALQRKMAAFQNSASSDFSDSSKLQRAGSGTMLPSALVWCVRWDYCDKYGKGFYDPHRHEQRFLQDRLRSRVLLSPEYRLHLSVSCDQRFCYQGSFVTIGRVCAETNATSTVWGRASGQRTLAVALNCGLELRQYMGEACWA